MCKKLFGTIWIKTGGTGDLRKWHAIFKPKLWITTCQDDGIKADTADVVVDSKKFESKVRSWLLQDY